MLHSYIAHVNVMPTVFDGVLHRELLLSMLGTLKSNLRETVRQQQSAAGSALGLGPPPLGTGQYPAADMAALTEQYAFLA